MTQETRAGSPDAGPQVRGRSGARAVARFARLAAALLMGGLAAAVVQSGCSGTLPVARDIPRADCAKTSTDALTLMTFNIRVGFGDGRSGVRPQYLAFARKDLAPIIASIRSLNPDIVALQEVLTRQQGQRIAETLGMHYAFSSHLGEVPFWGVALLSKCPIEETEVAVVSDAFGNKRRALIGSVALEDGTIAVASVHTDPDVDIDMQLGRVSEALAQRGDEVILMGDMNLPPTAKGLEPIRTRYTDTAESARTRTAEAARERGTIAARNTPKKRIDYILVPQTRWRVLDAGLSLDRHAHASDHRGYFAVIRGLRSAE